MVCKESYGIQDYLQISTLMLIDHKGQEYSAVNYSIKNEFAVGQEITKPIRYEISRCSKSQPALLKPGQSTSNRISTVMNISRHFMLAMLVRKMRRYSSKPWSCWQVFDL